MRAHPHPRTRVLASLGLVVLLACGGGDGPIGPPPDTDPFDGTATIDVTGGVMGIGTTVRVQIPPGALAGETDLVVEPVPTPPDLDADGAIGQAYRVSPTTLALAAPVRIAIVVPAAARDGRPMDAITIRRSTGGSGDLAPAGVELGQIERDASTGQVSGTTSQLGTFSATLAENRPPTVAAGDDQTVLVDQQATTSATATDPDGDDVSIEWSLASAPEGSQAEIEVEGDDVSIVPDLPGEYELVASVGDGRGGSAADTVVVTAELPVGAIVANAGSDQVVPVDSEVQLDGSASVGSGLRYSWRVLSAPGNPPSIKNSSRAQASFTPSNVGTYEIELEVTDLNVTDVDTVRISVFQPNRAPTVTLSGPVAVTVGETATVDAAISDPDGDALTLAFSLVGSPDGSGAVLVPGPFSASVDTDVVGEYEIRADVSDGELVAAAVRSVWANPEVAGAYETDFAITNLSDGCPDSLGPGDTTGMMSVEQPSPGTVTLKLTELNDAITTDVTGDLRGNEFSYAGPLTITDPEDGDPSVTLNAVIEGTIDGSVLDFEFTLSAFTCSVDGTIIGTRP